MKRTAKQQPKILITGANGLIGHHLCRRLLEEGHSVWALSRREHPALLKPLLGHPHLNLLKGDITDPEFTGRLFRMQQFDVVFHLAVERYFSGPEPQQRPVLLQETSAYQTNFLGTLNLLQSIDVGSVSAWIQSSAMMVFDIENIAEVPVNAQRPPSPAEPNGMSVFLGEQTCHYFGRTAGLNYLILRYPGVYGRGKDRGVIARFVRTCLNDNEVTLEAPADRTADFLYVKDAVEANLLALQKLRADVPAESPSRDNSSHQRIFHIGGGAETSVADVARIVLRLTGNKGNLRVKNSGNPRRFYFDISAARRELGFHPRPLEEGLADYVRESKGVEKK